MATRTMGKVILQQGADDDEILELKSSDVAHGMTDRADTDAFGALSKVSATEGGLNIGGYSEGTRGVRVAAEVTTGDTTKSTAAVAPMFVNAALKNGTGVTVMGANENLMVVANASTVRFILDADGDSHQDVGTAWTNFDVCHDVEMLNVLSAFATRPTDPLRGNFQKWLAVPENRDRLEVLGIATFNDGPGGDGSIFVNMSKLSMLLVGAVRQIHDRFTALEARVARLLPET